MRLTAALLRGDRPVDCATCERTANGTDDRTEDTTADNLVTHDGTADATGNYSIMVPLGNGSNTFKVTTSDAFGQSITGEISPVTWSANPPTVVNTPPKTA